MMTRKLLFVLVTAIISVSAMAQTYYEQDGLGYLLYTPEDGSPYAQLIGCYLGSDVTDLIIPTSVSDNGTVYTVTSIGGEVLLGHISYVFIPYTVISMAPNPFYNSYLLK